MNPQLDPILRQAEAVLNTSDPITYRGPVHVGVDLGTAYTVLLVLDQDYRPLAGRYQFAQIVRDGLVVDFIGAIRLLSQMKAEVETQLGFTLEQAATSYPPGVAMAEVKATRNVLIGAGLECSSFLDEPSAANSLLQIDNGAVVDVGGGTTGVAVIENGEVVYTADEPTGGTQFSLVIAGAMGISFEEAEELKKKRSQQSRLVPLVRPVMQKVGTIVARHVAAYDVERIYLVGGTSSIPGICDEVEAITGIKTVVPSNPLFVTPIGIAMQDK
ncbi:MAG: ethanolamine utilization protein EutJ [Anaerolineae bacterium]|nr:ethanolamine utilization protein EutJ [Anaerolineae bacterium]